jgi:effector-binding domain-containing protein
MKILKYIALSLLGLIGLLLIVSLFLPTKNHIERSIEINSKPKHVFALINNFKAWKQWSPWHKKDTNSVYNYSEIFEGNGASFSWKSNHPDVGNGTMKIVSSIPNEKVEIELTLNDFGGSRADFVMKETNGIVKLTWNFDSDTKDLPMYWVPISKIFGLFMDGILGPDYETGLKSIKEVAEKKTDIEIGGFEAEIRSAPPLFYIALRNQLREEEIGPKLGENYAFLTDLTKQLSAKQTGVPFTINYAAKGKVYDMATCLGVESEITVTPPVIAGKIEAGKQLVIKYYGPYEKIGPLYSEGFKYIIQNNLKAAGAPMEFYVTDPMLETDNTKWLTELVFPINE